MAEGSEDDKAEHHASASGGERPAPAVGVAHRFPSKWGQACADVDAHVEDRKSRVASRVALHIQVADQRRDIGLKEAVAKDKQSERTVKSRLAVDREDEVASRKQRSSDQDRARVTELPVSKHAPKERGEIDEPHVVAVHGEGLSLGELEMLVHIQREQSDHQIEAEALPHLCKEKNV